MGKKSNLLTSVFTKESALAAYKEMVLIRKFEEKCGQIYGMGQIAGFCHLCIGQEAVATGMISCLKPGDAVITGYRDHGHNIAMGTDPKLILAELMGRSTGISKGKGGSMHLFDTQKGFFGGHGIVGAQVSIGTGIAFAKKYSNTDNVCLAFFGDGAANQGQVYEAFNMAKIWNLPVLYVVENNRYAMGTSVERHSASKTFHERGSAYGINGKIVDGMDILAVRSATIEALEAIRNGAGPMLLEMQTYRYRGHSMSDPAKYRTKEEVEEYKQKNDPIGIFEAKLKAENWISDDEIEVIAMELKGSINEMYEFSLNSAEPQESELYTEVYC